MIMQWDRLILKGVPNGLGSVILDADLIFRPYAVPRPVQDTGCSYATTPAKRKTGTTLAFWGHIPAFRADSFASAFLGRDRNAAGGPRQDLHSPACTAEAEAGRERRQK